jgi:hypothetical protein
MRERSVKDTIRDEVRRAVKEEVEKALKEEVESAVQEALTDLPANIRRIAEDFKSRRQPSSGGSSYSRYSDSGRSREPDMNYHN